MKTYASLLTLLPLILLLACELLKGPEGNSSLVNIVDEPSGKNCIFGGIRIEAGIDKDNDEVLDPDEIHSIKFVCNGSPGKNFIIKATPVLPNSACAYGGVLLEKGLDKNENGQLDADEIDQKISLCNGNDGYNTLFLITPEEKGITCIEGGVKIQQGVDLNRNNVLDKEEINQTKFICNGQNGSSVITIKIEEPSGVNCLTGGIKTQAGFDKNGNLDLDTDEIQLTKYDCYSQLIEYPDKSLYGDNILDKAKTEYTTRDVSLCAKIPPGGKLKIRIRAVVPQIFWGWVLGTSENWRASSFDFTSYQQTFESIESNRTCELNMVFDRGEHIVEYYELDYSKPSFTKKIKVNY